MDNINLLSDFISTPHSQNHSNQYLRKVRTVSWSHRTAKKQSTSRLNNVVLSPESPCPFICLKQTRYLLFSSRLLPTQRFSLQQTNIRLDTNSPRSHPGPLFCIETVFFFSSRRATLHTEGGKGKSGVWFFHITSHFRLLELRRGRARAGAERAQELRLRPKPRCGLHLNYTKLL